MAPRASSLLPPLSRRQLQRIVLEANTRGGRLYNLVIFATILLSVAGLLLEPTPQSFSSELQQGGVVVWIDAFCLLVFLIDYVLHVALSPTAGFGRGLAWPDQLSASPLCPDAG